MLRCGPVVGRVEKFCWRHPSLTPRGVVGCQGTQQLGECKNGGRTGGRKDGSARAVREHWGKKGCRLHGENHWLSGIYIVF